MNFIYILSSFVFNLEDLLAVDITFESLPTFAQGSSQLAKMLHDVVISAVLSSTNISVGRIGNMTVLWSQDSVWFALKKPAQNFIDGKLIGFY